MSLLNKTRSLNRLLQREAGKTVSFNEIARVLSSTIQSNIFVVSRKGKILGFASTNIDDLHYLESLNSDDLRFPLELNERLLELQETTINISTNHIDTASALFSQILQPLSMTVVPIVGSGERLGSLVLAKMDSTITDDDLILAEYSTTIVAMEILRQRTEEIAEEVRQKAIVSVAVNTLSYSEQEAVEHIFEELNGKEGLLVASKIADRVGITRSVIVNALRKLESAGVIETRSLGMKGTYIKIIIFQLVDVLRTMKN
jgi:transcriptional pleiotropic repressor